MKKFKVVAGRSFRKRHKKNLVKIFNVKVYKKSCRILAKIPKLKENKEVFERVCQFYDKLKRRFAPPISLDFGLGILGIRETAWIDLRDETNYWIAECKIELKNRGDARDIEKEISRFRVEKSEILEDKVIRYKMEQPCRYGDKAKTWTYMTLFTKRGNKFSFAPFFSKEGKFLGRGKGEGWRRIEEKKVYDFFFENEKEIFGKIKEKPLTYLDRPEMADRFWLWFVKVNKNGTANIKIKAKKKKGNLVAFSFLLFDNLYFVYRDGEWYKWKVGQLIYGLDKVEDEFLIERLEKFRWRARRERFPRVEFKLYGKRIRKL